VLAAKNGRYTGAPVTVITGASTLIIGHRGNKIQIVLDIAMTIFFFFFQNKPNMTLNPARPPGKNLAPMYDLVVHMDIFP
jgi:hypothetical protein